MYRGLIWLVLLAGSQLGAAVVTWTGAGNGASWSDPHNWSGNSVPTGSDDITIGAIAPNASITINVTGTVAAQSVTSAAPVIVAAGTLQVAGSVQLSNTLTLAGGTIKGAKISGTNGATLRLTNGGGTFDGVTVAAGLTLDGSQTNANYPQSQNFLSIVNGLTLNGSAKLGSADGSVFCQMSFVGTQTLGGTGTVTLGGSTSNAVVERSGGTNVLTIDTGITIQGGSGIIGAFGTYQSTESLLNKGTITIPATQTVNLNATVLTNQGTITVAGATVTLGSSLTMAGLGTFNGTGATIYFTGTLNNQGATATFSPALGLWLLAGGTINGGTLASTGGATLRLTGQSGTLDGVTIAAGLTLDGSQTNANYPQSQNFVSIADGLTLNGSAKLGSADGSVFCQMSFLGTQTLGGTGTVTLGGSTNNAVVERSSGTNVLTIDTGITIQGGSGIIGAFGTYQSTESLLNKGTITIPATQTVNLNATVLTNQGTITVTGANVTLASSFTLAGLGTFNATGAKVYITGTLNNQSAVTTLSPSLGQWLLAGGTINGGTLASTGGATLRFTGQGGTLDGVTIAAGLTLDGAQTNANYPQNQNFVSIADGLTLNGSATLGSADGSTFCQMSFLGAQTLSGTGTITLGSSASNAVVERSSGTNVLTIDTGITIQGGSGIIGAFGTYAATESLLNKGKIIIPSGQGVNLNASVMTNQGTITVGGASITLGGAFTSASLGTFNATGATVYLTGTFNNQNTVTTLSPSLGRWLLAGGTINGGTLASTGGATLRLTGSGGTFDGVTVAAGLTLDGAQTNPNYPQNQNYVSILDGLTLNGSVTLGSADGSTSCQISFLGAQTLSGTGTITLGSSTSNAIFERSSGTNLLTIDTGITIQGGSGTIGAYGTYAATESVLNKGTITIPAAQTVYLDGTVMTNQGTITVAGANVVLGSSFTLAGLGTFNATGATVYLTGTLNNQSAVATLSPSLGQWLLAGGTVNGGTLASTGGATLRLTGSGGTLDGVAIAAGLTLDGTHTNANYPQNQNSVSIVDGLTFNGSALLGSTDGSVSCQLYFLGAQTLTGTGTLTLGGANDNSIVERSSGTNLLTIDTGITIQGGVGTIGSYGTYQAVEGILNKGTIRIASGGSASLGGAQFTNRGTITASGGGTVALNFPLTTANLAQITAPGGHLNLTSVLDNTGATLALSDARGSVNLAGGTLLGGVVSATGSAQLTATGGTLDGVTLQTNLALLGTSLTVKNGLTLAGHARITTSANSDTFIDFAGTQTLGGDGEIFFAASNSYITALGNNTVAGAAALTIGDDIVLHGSQKGTVRAYYASDSVVNRGAIEADTANQTITLSGSTFDDRGTLSATNGGRLSVTGSLSLNDHALFISAPASNVTLGSDLLGNTTSAAAAALQGTITLASHTSASAPQKVEVMSTDLGAVAAGFSHNFAFGTIILNNATYARLVDTSPNETSAAPEALYTQSIIVPQGTTLDLNGLHLYARTVQQGGTVLNGSIIQLPNAGPLTTGVATPGTLSAAGALDEWTFFGHGGHNLTVQLNPGATGTPAAVSPQLQWAHVQLLDPAGHVLAEVSDTVANAVLTLGNILLPSDGVYKIHINAPASHTSVTGNYLVGAWDVTPDIRSLNLGQASTGNLSSPFAVDQWTFSANAAQQIQFHLVGTSSAGILFKLTGPNGFVGFTDLSADSTLIDLPASGSYTISAYGSGSAVGAYAFQVNQTSVAPLTLGGSVNGTWSGSGQAQLYKIVVSSANPLTINLADLAATDHVELYARFGVPPTRETYDYAVTATGASHTVLVPFASPGTWYVLAYGESIGSAGTAFTLSASSTEVVVASSSNTQSAVNIDTSVALTGAGFTSGSKVTAVATDGTVYSAAASLDLPTQLTATFTAGTLPAGSYSLVVTQPDGASSKLATPLVVAPLGQPVFSAHVDVPNPIGRHIATTIYVSYTNTGNAPMPAPLLVLTATNPSGQSGAFMTLDPALQTAGFWTSAVPAGYSSTLQILASGATPGVLQPGESMRIPVYYAGWLTSQWDFSNTGLNFALSTIKADDATSVDWSARESAMRPAGMSSAAWHTMYSSLVAQLGTTAGGYVRLLNQNASYLAQLGRNVSDVSKLWGFAVAQTENLWVLPTIGKTADDVVPTPGRFALKFDREFNNTIPGRFRAGLMGLGWFSSWEQTASVASDGTVTIAGGNGASATYQPDSRGAGQYFSQPGDTTKLSYDGQNYRLTALTGDVTAFNADGTLNYLQDTSGNRIVATYAGKKLSQLKASSGQYMTLSYNPAGLIDTLQDSFGRITRYTYDSANLHLVTVTSYDGSSTSYTYDTGSGGSGSSNAITAIVLPDGSHRNFTYDAGGRLGGISAEGGVMPRSFSYRAGQVSIADAASNISTLFFDENGRLGKSVDPMGRPTFYKYDGNNVIAITNAAGQSTAMVRNGVGLVTTLTNLLGYTTNLTYESNSSRLSTQTDANGNLTSYTYDPTGNLASIAYANGKSKKFKYDSGGTLASRTNAGGGIITYAHDTNGQLTKVTYPDGSAASYSYDSEGKLASANDASGAINFTYDPATRLLKSVTYPNGTALTLTYDSAGRRSSLTDQAGCVTKYEYDAIGRLKTLKDGSGASIAVYEYDANGRLSQKTEGNGNYTTFQYDGAGEMVSLVNHGPGGTINSRFDDTYDSLGLKTAESTLEGKWAYTYDASGQLTRAKFTSNNSSVTPDRDISYAYDPMGNRSSVTTDGVVTRYVANAVNQYDSVGGVACLYDSDGNVVSDGTHTNAYDAMGRIVSVAAGTSVTNYTYDPLGQRSASTTDGVATRYLNDPQNPGNVLGAYNASLNPVAQYRFGVGLVSQVAGGKDDFYDTDPVGSVVGLSGASGSYLNRYVYLPFGQIASSSETIANPLQYLGGYGVTQGSGGLVHLGLREYDPSSGRFSGDDPIDLLGGDFNLRRYAGNNPVSFVDPAGCSSVHAFLNNIGAVETAIWDAGVAAYHYYDALKSGADSFEHAELAEFGLNAWRAGEGVSLTVGRSFFLGIATESGGFAIAGEIGATVVLGPELAIGVAVVGAGLAAYDLYKFGKAFKEGLEADVAATRSIGQIQSLDGTKAGSTSVGTVAAQDPNAIYGPTGHGAANYVADLGGVFAYRVTFENDAKATAPAQSVTVVNPLGANLDWTTFQLTGIGFGDFNLTIPAGSQHYQKTVSMTYNGQTFYVQMEAGIRSATGQVYATFQSLDPLTGLPPSNVLTGFLPPENGTGRGQGYLTYTVAPKQALSLGTVIPNVATITFDDGVSIATNQVSETDPSQGTDPAKEARVTIDSTAPTAQVTALPALVAPSFQVSWSGSDTGSGVATYSVYVSNDAGKSWTTWLTNTTATSGIYPGAGQTSYSFYVTATDFAGNTQTVNPQQVAVTTTTEAAPRITPGDLTALIGASVTLTASYSGAAPVTYQWSKDSVLLPGATGATLVFAAAQLSDSGRYTVAVTDALGSGISDPVKLTVSDAAAAPQITTQPVNREVASGAAAAFTVVATGNPAPAYQWRKGGAAISGATLATLSFASAAPGDAGSYDVVVTNSGGSVTSNAATLVVDVAPAIVTQPQGQAVASGHAVTFSVVATGTPAPGYQWSKDGNAITGATNTTYAINAVQASDAGSYTVTVSNNQGSVTSTAATLTITAAPTITTQPQSVTVATGQSTSFTVVASGTPVLAYQWSKNSAAITGATNATYAINAVQASDGGSYTVAVSNSQGSVTSAAATLTITAAPTITTQPQNVTVATGQSASFTVVASGTPVLAYQWSKNSVAITGATNATYAINAVQASDAGNYTVKVSNAQGNVTSTAATLTISAALAINTQPQSLAVAAGQSASFTVAASGAPAPTYQWAKNGTAITGATSATYTINAVQVSDAGSYTVTVSNSQGSVTSNTASLTVTAAPTITTQPQSVTIAPGQGANFTVVAIGTPAPAYQWSKNGSIITGATNSVYMIAAAQATDAGSYTVAVTNTLGSVTSQVAVLTVTTSGGAPVITTQPQTAASVVGGSASLTVVATGSPAPGYQWRKDGVALAGATSATLTINPVKSTDLGNYSVVVTNTVGSATSVTVPLSIVASPVITGQPGNVIVTAPARALFGIGVSATPYPTYRWQREPAGTTDWSDLTEGAVYSGVATASFEINSPTTAMSGDRFRCVVSNGLPPDVTSNVVSLTVKPSASGATIHWTAASGDFNTASNWDANRVPGPSDIAIIDQGTFTLPGSGTITAGQVMVSVPYSAPTGSDFTLNITGAWTFSGPVVFAPGRAFGVTGAGSVVVTGPTTIDGASLAVDGGAKFSLPAVTSYVASSSSAWSVYHDSSKLSLPNLATITGSLASNSYLTVQTYYGANLISLPALTSIIKTDDGDAYANSGVRFAAHDGGVISAPMLTTFKDIDTNPASTLEAYTSSIVDMPLLTAPVGVAIALNSQSKPQRFTSLVNGRILQITAGSVVMDKLASIDGLSLEADTGASLSLPAVTSYNANAGVSWTVYHDGATLTLPNLATISGALQANAHLTLQTYYGANLISLPALTSIIKSDDGDPYANSGVTLAAHDGGTISAPALTTFSDIDKHPDSTLESYTTSTVDTPLLSAPSGVAIAVNAQSNPQRFTSLVNGRILQITAGSVVMDKLTSIDGLSLEADAGASLSLPAITAYNANAGVTWTVFHDGATLILPNLATISGSLQANAHLTLQTYYGANLISLPALTSIIKSDDGDPYANSGVTLAAHDGGTISAPALTTFNDIDKHPDSTLEAYTTSIVDTPLLIAPVGVAIALNAQSNPQRFTSLVNGRILQITAGSVVMDKLTSIDGLSLEADAGATLSLPAITSYNANSGVTWTVFHDGATLILPNLVTISGSLQANAHLTLQTYYGANLISLPALTSIIKSDDGDPYANSGVTLAAHDGGTISAPVLVSFKDNDKHPDSSIEVYNSSTVSVPLLAQSAVRGLTLVGLALPVVPPNITSALTATAAAGAAFDYQITADLSPVIFAATNLPAGLTIDPNTGLISGQIASAGSVAVTIQATNAVGSDSRTLTITAQAPVAVPAPASLVAWWRGEFSANDSVGSSHGTLVNGVSYTTGEVGKAFNLDSTGRVAIPEATATDLSRMAAWTIEAWVRPTNITDHTWPTIYSEGRWGASLGLNQTTGKPESWINNSNTIVGVVPVQTNAWNHVALVYDGTKRTFYINGIFAGSGSAPAITADNNGAAIGDVAYNSNSSQFEGQIDEVSLYSRALTPAEILTVYAAGSGGKSVAVATAPSITTQPASLTVTQGSAATFSVTATGTPAPTYQWRKDGTAIAGATQSSYAIASAVASNAGSYDVVVSNSVTSVTSSAATLTVNIAPVITQQPASQSAVAGGNVTLSVVATGSPVPTYQWRKDATTLAGATGATLALNNVQPADAGSYTVVVTNSAGSVTSSAATLTINTVPTITQQPVDVGVALGGHASFTVAAAGTPTPTWQWRKNGTAITGATSATLALDNVQAGDAGTYTVVVSNVAGSVTSNPAVLAIYASPVFTSAGQATATAGAAFSFGVNATGTPAPAYSVSAGTLPGWLTLNAATGALAGTVPASGAGTYNFTLQATNLAGSATQSFALTVKAAAAPVIQVAPVAQTSGPGLTVTFWVGATGSTALTYQWTRDGVPLTDNGRISGSATATLTLTGLQSSDAGTYAVTVKDTVGGSASASATLTVVEPFATHSVAGQGYVPGGQVTISSTFAYSASADALGWQVVLPAGWSLASSSGQVGSVAPALGTTDVLEWAWLSVPATPITFTYTLNVPANQTGDQTISAIAIQRLSGQAVQVLVKPDPLPVKQVLTHSADEDHDGKISLTELTRVIELYNTRNGTVRTGCYKINAASEDGFDPEPTRPNNTPVTLSGYHSADEDHDGKLSLLELTRVIELFNYRVGTVRTGQYHAQAGTEDGFALGP